MAGLSWSKMYLAIQYRECLLCAAIHGSELGWTIGDGNNRKLIVTAVLGFYSEYGFNILHEVKLLSTVSKLCFYTSGNIFV